jgi:hypothetical protein
MTICQNNLPMKCELEEPEEITDQLTKDDVNPDTTIEVIESHKIGSLIMQNFHTY